MHLNRRRFPRAAGVSFALPWLEALAVRGARAAAPPRRLVCICTPLGLHAPFFFPQQAGGGFKHGQHLAFDPKNPPPLSNLYVTLLRRLGIQADRFAASTGALKGLETAG